MTSYLTRIMVFHKNKWGKTVQTPSFEGDFDRQLGHRTLRIPAAGACKPYRLHDPHTRPAEDHAGGHHVVCVRALLSVLHGREIPPGLHLGRPLPLRRRLLHLPQVTHCVCCSNARLHSGTLRVSQLCSASREHQVNAVSLTNPGRYRPRMPRGMWSACL